MEQTIKKNNNQKLMILVERVEEIRSKFDNATFKLLQIPDPTRLTQTVPTVVTPAFCSDCIICQDMCPLLRYDPANKIMTLHQIACKGCGNCIPTCPTAALEQRNSSWGAIGELVNKELDPNYTSNTPTICNYCPVRCGQVISLREEIQKNNDNGKSIRMICSGRLEPGFVFETFATGVYGIFLYGCRYDEFKFKNNQPIVEQRIPVVKELMKVLGIDSNRFKMEMSNLSDPKLFEALKEF